MKYCPDCKAEVENTPEELGCIMCEHCCPDHDYIYHHDRRGHFCAYCDKQRGHDEDI